MDRELNKINNSHQKIALIPHYNSLSQTLKIYNILHKKYPSKSIYILEPQNFICCQKLPEYDFFILFPPICSYHKPDHIEYLHFNTINQTPQLYKTKFEDRTKFLISRLSKIELIKTKTIFGIFFTSQKFLHLARKVHRFLHMFDKVSYLVYLENVSNERLTCIDNIEVVVLITCPYMIEFEMEVFLPVVTPFEIELAFCGDEEWDGEYDANRFEPKYNISDEIVLVENKIEILNNQLSKCEAVSVNYEIVDEIDEIVDGRKGIAKMYEDETDK